MENNYQEERDFILKNSMKADVEVLRLYASIKSIEKLEEIIKLIEGARTAQKNFYKSKPNTEERSKWLRASKLYESMLDDYVAKFRTPKLDV